MIASFARFDITNFVTPARRVLPAALLVLIAPVAAPWPALGIGAAAIVMSLLAANPFTADELGRLDTLYATLPITRRAVVLGRYVALIAIYLAAALAATVAAVITSMSGHRAVDFAALGAVNVAGFLAFAIALAVQLPFFFSLGFTRARPMVFIPAAVLVVAAVLASQAGLTVPPDVIGVVSRNLSAVLGGAVAIAVVALAGSAAISVARYRARDL